MSDILAIRPFVPAKDFEQSIAFYQALGFALGYRGSDIAILTLGSASFLLQDFYVEAFAVNFMMQLLVPNADAWWGSLDLAALAERFGTRPPTAPAMQPWGLKVGYITDPSGVLWHIAEPRA